MNKSRQYGLFTDVPDELWNDWHWQVANRIETLEDLKKYISLTPEEEEGVAKCLGTLRQKQKYRMSRRLLKRFQKRILALDIQGIRLFDDINFLFILKRL